MSSKSIDVTCRVDGLRARISAIIPMDASAKALARLQQEHGGKFDVVTLRGGICVSRVVESARIDDETESFGEVVVHDCFGYEPNVIH